MSNSEKPKSSWRERRQSIKHKWMVPFIFPEWICERLSYLLGRWAFLDILGHVGRLTILIAIIFYFTEADERRKAKHYQAWQVINSAQGKTTSGGRIDALQDLNRDGVSLAYLDLSKASLRGIVIENADLTDANLSGADLSGANLEMANLSGAKLVDANLAEAILDNANLSGADLADANLFMAKLRYAYLTEANLADANLFRVTLYRANLSEAYLGNANLSGANLSATLVGAYLSDANLAGAILEDANLAGAILDNANLSGANLWYANLSGADLRNSNLRDIDGWWRMRSIELANVYGVKNPPDGFIERAKERGAVSIQSHEEWKKLLLKKDQEKTKEK